MADDKVSVYSNREKLVEKTHIVLSRLGVVKLEISEMLNYTYESSFICIRLARNRI